VLLDFLLVSQLPPLVTHAPLVAMQIRLLLIPLFPFFSPRLDRPLVWYFFVCDCLSCVFPVFCISIDFDGFFFVVVVVVVVGIYRIARLATLRHRSVRRLVRPVLLGSTLLATARRNVHPAFPDFIHPMRIVRLASVVSLVSIIRLWRHHLPPLPSGRSRGVTRFGQLFCVRQRFLLQ